MVPKLPALSLLEARVLGVLVEKQRTVPDTYPLTLNALAAGCSQKTSRDPVLSVTEAEVQATVDRLRSLSLVEESSGGRVMRYAHNIERVLNVPASSGSTAIDCTALPTARRSRLSCTSLQAAVRARSSPSCRANPARARIDGRICFRALRRPRRYPPRHRSLPPAVSSHRPSSPR